jgi:hypothetical protein
MMLTGHTPTDEDPCGEIKSFGAKDKAGGHEQHKDGVEFHLFLLMAKTITKALTGQISLGMISVNEILCR